MSDFEYLGSNEVCCNGDVVHVSVAVQYVDTARPPRKQLTRDV